MIYLRIVQALGVTAPDVGGGADLGREISHGAVRLHPHAQRLLVTGGHIYICMCMCYIPRPETSRTLEGNIYMHVHVHGLCCRPGVPPGEVKAVVRRGEGWQHSCVCSSALRERSISTKLPMRLLVPALAVPRECRNLEGYRDKVKLRYIWTDASVHPSIQSVPPRRQLWEKITGGKKIYI